MPLRQNVYDMDLDIDGQLVELRNVRLTHGDEIRAELEASKQSLPTLPHVLTSLMMWAGCVRLGHFSGGYSEFRHGGLVEYRRVPDDELVDVTRDDEGRAVVDPTPAEPSDSASPSPLTSPATPTGQTPTSTTA